MAYLSRSDIEKMGFLSIGDNVLISSKASFYNCPKIQIGDNVRIDDFSVLSSGEGGIIIGNFIHIAIYTSLIGKGRIAIGDYSNISSRVSIYSSNDDYSGNYMTNPMVPPAFTNVSHLPVTLGKHVIIGSGSVILPGAELAEGVAIGALSVVKKNKLEPFTIYAGNPLKKIRNRSSNMVMLEKKLIKLIETNKGK